MKKLLALLCALVTIDCFCGYEAYALIKNNKHKPPCQGKQAFLSAFLSTRALFFGDHV